MSRRAPRVAALVAIAAVTLIAPAQAAAETVATKVAVVVGPVDPAARARDGAIGLLVPGAGSTVTREGALSSLERGRVVSSLLGGKATGPPLVAVSAKPAGPGGVTVYVELPPPGRTHNTRRYPIAIVGGGYHGLLVTHTTRIPGLVSIADVAPTVLALAAGMRPRVGARPDAQAERTLARLDQRLRRSHDARTAATVVFVLGTLILAALALLARSRLLGRATLLAIPSALSVALLLSAVGVSRFGPALAVLVAGTIGLPLALGYRREALLPALIGSLLLFLIVSAWWPEINSLSVIGPHPDGGGRYYGVTNEVETLLLVPVLGAVSLAPRGWFLTLGVLSLGVVGWSRAGADGGGIVVLLAALAVFWILREQVRVTVVRVIAAGVALVALTVALVGLDAATGGSSHVTHALGGGPNSIAGDLAHRLRISWKGVTATTQSAVAATLTLLALTGVGLRKPRIAVVDALIAGLVVSLLVNDTPTDVIAFGSLAAAALGTWAIVDVPPMRRTDEGVFLQVSPVPSGR